MSRSRQSGPRVPTAPIRGRSIDPNDFQAVRRPIAAMAKDYPDGWVNPWHRHRRAQLVYASSGVMTIATPHGTWVVPPNRAAWMPAETEHSIRSWGDVAMRTLYVRADVAATKFKGNVHFEEYW